MKQAFTTFSSQLRKTSKLSGLTPLGYVKAYSEEMQGTQPQLGISLMMLELLVIEGAALHIYLPERTFCQWLVDCVGELDSNHAGMLQQMIGQRNVGVLHFPCSAKCYSLAFRIFDDIVIGRFTKESKLIGLKIKLNKEAKSVWNDDLSDECMWYAKLIVGLGMYSNCFPEVVRDGPPSDLKHPSAHNHESTRTIGISNRVTSPSQGHHDSPVAHFRRGHFRILSSERFTTKRFQAVFIRETFVAGKAKTILTPEEVDAYSSGNSILAPAT